MIGQIKTPRDSDPKSLHHSNSHNFYYGSLCSPVNNKITLTTAAPLQSTGTHAHVYFPHTELIMEQALADIGAGTS